MRTTPFASALVATLLLVGAAPTAAGAAAHDRVLAAATTAGAPAYFPGALRIELVPGGSLPGGVLTTLVAGIRSVAPAFPAVDPVGAAAEELARWLTAEVLPGTEDAVATALRGLPQVARVERVAVRVPAYEPNDPRRRDQWHLDRIAAGTGWNVQRGGHDIRLGIIDTQFDAAHPELRGVLVGRDGRAGVDTYADGCRAGVPFSEHGTLVAGVAAATSDNGAGVSSVGFRIGVVAAQAGTELGGICAISGRWTEALVDQVDAGVPVVNLSFASPQTSALEAAALRYAADHGTLVVAAAGNEGTTTPFYPAADPSVLGVAATGADDRLWPSSNRGPWVDVAAPGVSLLTLCPGGYCYATGTSTATPVVAAVATLLRGAQPGLEGMQLRNRILDAAAKVTGRGVDPELGYGRVRLDRTLDSRAIRLYGRDRIATAQAIAREAHPSAAGGGVSRVVLVPADSPGDAGWTVTLPAAGLLADGHTLFVVTGRAELHPLAQAELARVLDGTGEVVVVGTTTTGVSAAVEHQVAALGYDVSRLAGTDAAATAARIADEIVRTLAPRGVLVARGDTFADALALSGPAAAYGYPLLFVEPDGVPAATCDWLGANRSVATIYVAGGTRAIASGVDAELEACAEDGLALLSTRDVTVVRDAGASRVDTAIAIARRHFGTVAPAVVSVANGYRWPDAVTGGTLARSHGAPVLTTGGSGRLETALRTYLADGETRTAFVLGGDKVVADSIDADLEAALR